MSKIAIISDLHIGIKKSNDLFINSQLNFLKNEFIPYLKKHNIIDIYILGDVFDNRTTINIKIKNLIYDLFEKNLNNFNITILVGNHDSYYNSSIKVNSLKFLSKFNNVNIIEDNTEIKIDGRKILLCPWQTNVKNFEKYLADTHLDTEVCLGHFPIAGFHLNKFQINNEGFSGDLFYKNFKLIFTGHFHTRSKQKRDTSEIIYIGAPYHLTRSDIDEEKGFCILNLKDLTYEYINNKTSIRYVLVKYPEKVTKKLIKGNIIDIQVQYDDKYNEDKVQKYIKYIEAFEPISSPTIKILNCFNGNVDLNGDYSVKNSYELMNEYIEKLDIQNKTEIFTILERLYQEAMKAEL